MTDLSVIIPTWNNCQRLAITLNAIAACRVLPGLGWEVIVVANACTDDTADVTADFTDHLPLTFVEELVPGAGIARNRGIAMARGKLLVFADDDVRPEAGWLEAYWQAFVQFGARYFYGGPLSNEHESPPDEALLRVASPIIAAGFDLGKEVLAVSSRRLFMGANWAAPVDAVRTVGGFDPELAYDGRLKKRRAGEDADLMERLEGLGLRGLYLPAARVTHFVPAYKCTPPYVAGHIRALGVYSLCRKSVDTALQNRPWLSSRLGEEKWTARALARLAVATVVLGARQAMQPLRRQSSYEDRMALAYCLGRWEGYFTALRRWIWPRTPAAVTGFQRPGGSSEGPATDRETANWLRPSRGDG